MGQVYEAIDQELGESIAIKAIKAGIADSPGTIARFKREVYATRKITHPNVCRTFDLECHTDPGGTPGDPRDSVIFLTMELLHGETLAQRLHRDGALPADRVYVLAVQVAGALAAAHEAGVIHCDLKPSNIFLTGSDSRLRAVVTDFGIARISPLYDQTRITASPETTTRTGEIIGTPDYMAPEQFRTRECTPATDIYSFGLILYEALTGLRGFADSPSEEVLRNKLAGSPNAATGQLPVAKQWSYLLSRCLQIDPQHRFHQIDEVLEVLGAMPAPHGRLATSRSRKTFRFPPPRTTSSFPANDESWLVRHRWPFMIGSVAAIVLAGGIAWFVSMRPSLGGSPPAPTVAVLPVSAPGNNAQVAALGDDLAEELTNNLAQVSGIRVASEAVVRNLGHPSDVRIAGRSLKVGAVVSGLLTPDAEGMRLVLSLVDVQSGAQIWGQSYHCKLQECASLSPDIAQEVAFRLELNADGENPRRARSEHSQIPAAEAAYQKGEQELAEHTPAGFAQALDSFQQAVDADPQDAPAMAELARCYALMAYNYNRPEAPLALLRQAEETSRRALQLDGTSAEAYSSLAEVEVLKDFNWTAAEKDFKRAIELDPSYLPAHTSYAFHLLTPLGRFAEARAQYTYDERLPQKNISAEMSMAITDFYDRQPQQSIDRLQKLSPSMPGSWPVTEGLVDNELILGDPQKALAVLSSVSPPAGDAASVRDALLGIVFAKSGRRADALHQLEQIRAAQQVRLNYPLATLLAALGYNEEAVDSLEKAAANRETDILFLGVDPMLDSLRSNARFHALAVKLNLVEAKENAP